MDTNHHFVINNNRVRPKESFVYIGDYCWIGNNTTIGKGCILPSNTIVAARSLVSKDYTEYGENCFLAGSPATLKSKNVSFLFNIELEENIQAYFDLNKDAEYYSL